MELKENQTEYFNNLLEKAGSRQQNLILLKEYNYKSIGFFGKRKLRKSISEFEECLEMIPDHWESMFLMAKAHQRLGEHNKSLKLLEKAFKIETDNPMIPMEAALESMHMEDIDKAIFYSEESLKRKPNDFALLGNHAMNLLIAKRDEEAKIVIEQAIELFPNDPNNQNVEAKINNVIAGEEKRPTFKDVI